MMTLSTFAQGPYAPAAGVDGTTAIHKDSSIFKDWATEVFIHRGKQDISKYNSDTASLGIWSNVLGKADGTSIVSLGDSGYATLQFSSTLYNGAGPDFAIFENAFNNTFLELAFVEVSSDGVHFFRFPSHSLTDTIVPVGGFGAVNPRDVYNFAGKYSATYGTPFDLEELVGTTGLDLQNITHIRVVDAIGTLDNTYAQRDSKGRKVNDNYPTPFPSGGFDLEAVGAIYIRPVGIQEHSVQTIQLYPNPVKDYISVTGKQWSNSSYSVLSSKGRIVKSGNLSRQIELTGLSSGIYFLEISNESGIGRSKFIVE